MCGQDRTRTLDWKHFFLAFVWSKKKKNPKSPDLMSGHSGIPGSLSSRSAFHFCTKAEHEPDLVLICKCNGISSFTCSLKKIVDLTHLKGIVVWDFSLPCLCLPEEQFQEASWDGEKVSVFWCVCQRMWSDRAAAVFSEPVTCVKMSCF